MAAAHTPSISPPPGSSPALVAVLVLLLAGASPAPAQGPALFDEAESPWIDGPTYDVSQFVVMDSDETSPASNLDGLLPLEVNLSPSPTGFIAWREGFAAQPVRARRAPAS